jgi:hypothetical protein
MAPFDHRIAGDPALTGMNEAWLGAFTALHLAGYKSHAAGAAVAGTAVMREVDAVAQGSVQQQLAVARLKAIAIECNLVTFCHCLIPEDFKFPVCGWCSNPPRPRFPGCSANQAFWI